MTVSEVDWDGQRYLEAVDEERGTEAEPGRMGATSAVFGASRETGRLGVSGAFSTI